MTTAQITTTTAPLEDFGLSVATADGMPALRCSEDSVLKLSRPKTDRQETDGRVSVTRPPGPRLWLAGFGWLLVNVPDAPVCGGEFFRRRHAGSTRDLANCPHTIAATARQAQPGLRSRLLQNGSHGGTAGFLGRTGRYAPCGHRPGRSPFASDR